MTKPLNVDICVTCICDKPPKLPLREELPSLGIEVIYNAEGVGEEAAERELAKRRKKHRRQTEVGSNRTKKTMNTGQETKNDTNEQNVLKVARDRLRSRLNPPGKSLRSPVAPKSDPPDDLEAPQALSYSRYQRSLDLRNNKIRDGTTSVTSSIETSSTMDENLQTNNNILGKNNTNKTKRKKKKMQLFGLLGRKKKEEKETALPKSVDIPFTRSQEEVALEEAFNAFLETDDEHERLTQEALDALLSSKQNSDGKGSRDDDNRNDFPDLLGEISNNRRTTNNKSKAVHSFSPVLQPEEKPIGKDSPYWNRKVERDADKLSNDINEIAARALSPSRNKHKFIDTSLSDGDNDSFMSNNEIENDAAEFNRNVSNVVERKGSTTTGDIRDDKRGNITVTLLNNGANIMEMYDLTEISDGGQGRHHNRHQDGPEEETFYSHDVSNSSNTVPAKHHVWSPIQQRHQQIQQESVQGNHRSTSYAHSELDEESSVPVPEEEDDYGNLVLVMSDVYEEDGPGSPLVLSPVQERNIGIISTCDSFNDKYNLPSFDEDLHFQKSMEVIDEANFDERDDENYTTSPYQRLGIADPYRLKSPINRQDDILDARVNSKLSGRIPTFDQAVQFYYGTRFSPASMPRMPATVTLGTKMYDDANYLSSSTNIIPALQKEEYSQPKYLPSMTNLVPALRMNNSRDSINDYSSSRLQPKVSFSHDIEERTFSKVKYEEKKVPLAAIIHEDRDLTEPLPSALSREANNEAFQFFADKLGIDDDDEPSPEMMLLKALSYGDPLPWDFEETIQQNPSIAMDRLPEVDTFALHIASSRSFPKRFGKHQTCSVKDLIKDLSYHQKLIKALLKANPETCQRTDVNGDLPVHILARHLMEWEAQWYQKVYDTARNDEDEKDKSVGITTLYKNMAECIDILLQPITRDDSLCLQSGSVGRLLPLHIAAIFTVPYNTLRSLLETFPNAASTKCDLNEIRTFIPNDSTPLELHDRLSTDFPKWEMQRINPKQGEEITQDMLDKVYNTENGMRRSDLMFAFSPKILPYRKEAYRIRRLEQMIQNEMKAQDGSDNYFLSPPAEKFWIWLCQFRNQDDSTDHYASSVAKVIDFLPFHAVRYLASINNEEGYPVIDRAMPLCADLIIHRMKKISETEIPIPVRSLSTENNPKVQSLRLRQFDEDTANRFSLQGKGFIGPLCRAIFNIKETAFPTSFVLLPYKLVKDQDGNLSLESSKAAKSAMEFANYLSHFTLPENIINVIDQKIEVVHGRNIVDPTTKREYLETQQKRKNYFNEFLKLYVNEPAYFYFIDDYTGIPIVSENNGIYPLVIRDAAEVVQKVFPLMLSGMILMRGEKSIGILTNVLLNDRIKVALPHWIAAAKDLIGYLFSPCSCSKVNISSVLGLVPFREDLLNFIRREMTDNGISETFYNSGLSSEWVVEVSLIKMIIEMHDKKHSYCGLLQQRARSQVLWTYDTDFPYLDLRENRKQIDFKSSAMLMAQLHGSDKIETQKLKGNTDVGRKYGFLFEDSVTSGSSSSDNDHSSSSSDSSEYSSEDDMPGMIITTTSATTNTNENNDRNKINLRAATTPMHTKKKYAYKYEYSANEMQTLYQPKHYNLSNFDDSIIDLDDMSKLRVQLDEQEGKLGMLRQKITSLNLAEDRLINQEDNTYNMISEAINQKDGILQSSKQTGLTQARALLLRMCELEDRVLCREVEVGQLKNDITCFEIEVSDRTEDRQLVKTESNDGSNASNASFHKQALNSGSSSSNSSSKNSSLDDDIITFESRDEPDSQNNYRIFNLDVVETQLMNRDADNSTVGNSTMYSSSIGGYSGGISS